MDRFMQKAIVCRVINMSRRTRGDRNNKAKPKRNKKAYSVIKENPQKRLILLSSDNQE